MSIVDVVSLTQGVLWRRRRAVRLLVRAARAADVLPKFDTDVQERSAFSACVSLVAVALLALLFVRELRDFRAGRVESSVGVDVHGRDTADLRAVLDIVFHALPCDEFGIDMVDTAGDMFLGVLDGSPLVREKIVSADSPLGEGCHVHGHLNLRRVRGEFHVAFGQRAEAAHEAHGGGQVAQHIHRFRMSEIDRFNASHTIVSLRFLGGAEPEPAAAAAAAAASGAAHTAGAGTGAAVDPADALAGTHRAVTEPGLTGRWSYFLQIVPTLHTPISAAAAPARAGHSLYLYGVTEHAEVVNPHERVFRQPGVFFRYEFSPYTVETAERRVPLSHFLRSCCAILGGVFVVVGFVSSAQWHTSRWWRTRTRRRTD